MSDSEDVPKWDSNLNFLLAMIGSAVGLGNIWRFPYVAYTNGGGAFMLPYIISIICMGIPMLFLEYGAGYKFKSGLSKIVRKINTKYEYIGWFMLASTFFILTYYVCVVAWDLLYVPLSFYKGWGSNPDAFFNNVILQSSADVGGLLHVVLFVFIAVVLIWLLLWFISHRNINDGVGLFNKILTPSLFVMMIVIVAFALTLPGAGVGVAKLLTPDWSSIGNLDIWLAALSQIMFSLSLGMSIVIAYSSYLPDDTNIPKSALTVAIANSSFEVFTAVGIFSILGFMSTTQNIPIDQLVTQGTGLAFVAFPQIFNVMGILGYILGPLFFLCLLFAGLTSNISIIEPIALAISNKFKLPRDRAVTITIVAGFIVSMFYVTSFGSTLVGITDTFVNQFGVVLNVILEIVLFTWIYNVDKFLPGINKNATFLRLGTFWKALVKYVLPIILFVIWVKGLYGVFADNDIVTMSVEVVLFILLLVLPAILTKLPAKSDDY